MRSAARKLTIEAEAPRPSPTVAPFLRRPLGALALSERRPPRGRRLREPAGVPVESRIVLRLGGPTLLR